MNAPQSPYPRHRPVSAADARAADRRALEEFGIPGLVLMEHASRGLAALVALERGVSRGPVAILCGPGQNGGDGLGCARFLHSWGIPVVVARLSARAPVGDAAIEFEALAREIEIASLVSVADVDAWARRAFEGASIVVDALYGTGLDRELDEPSQRAVDAINAAAAPRIAVDVPSGIDADSGEPRPRCVHADVTAAMGFVKLGCRTAIGARASGRVVEIDIGLPAAVHARWLADRPAN